MQTPYWYMGYFTTDSEFSEQLNHILWLYYEFRSGKFANYDQYSKTCIHYTSEQFKSGKLKIQDCNRFADRLEDINYMSRYTESLESNGLSEMENLRAAVHGLMMLHQSS